MIYDGITYHHSEGAFQASKESDRHIREGFAKMIITPNQAKHAGRGKRFMMPDGSYAKITLREDWEKVKNSVMYEIVRAKFEQDPDLKERLLATGDAVLIEGNNWHDNYWGDCRCSRCIGTIGFNQLGKTLMRVRAELGGAPYNEAWLPDYIGVQRKRRSPEDMPTVMPNLTGPMDKDRLASATFTLPIGALNGPLKPPCCPR